MVENGVRYDEMNPGSFSFHTNVPVYVAGKKGDTEEAVKMQQLRNTYGGNVSYSLFLCGYFDSGYLGYEAAEGIDWIWEHRISDIEQLGI